VTIYSITTKFGIQLHTYPNFQCTKLQGNQIMHFCFITTFTPLRKEGEKKRKETKPIFEGSYLVNTQCDLVEIWNLRWWHWLAFPLQKLFCFVKVSRSYVYVTNWCGVPASWAARHTTVCLDVMLKGRSVCLEIFMVIFQISSTHLLVHDPIVSAQIFNTS